MAIAGRERGAFINLATFPGFSRFFFKVRVHACVLMMHIPSWVRMSKEFTGTRLLVAEAIVAQRQNSLPDSNIGREGGGLFRL